MFRSYHILRELYSQHTFIREYKDAIQASLNLRSSSLLCPPPSMFWKHSGIPASRISSMRCILLCRRFPRPASATLCSKDTLGRLLSIFIVLVGVGLFLRLIQTIFRPAKVEYECPDCVLPGMIPMRGEIAFELRLARWYIESERLGRFTVGQQGFRG